MEATIKRVLVMAIAAGLLLAPALSLAQGRGHGRGHGEGGGRFEDRGGYEGRGYEGRGYEGRGYEGRGGYGGAPYGGSPYGGPGRYAAPPPEGRYAAPPGAYGPPRGYGAPAQRSWGRGQYLPPVYRGAVVPDPGRHRLRPPPPGYDWVGVGPDIYLMQRGTGLVLDAIPGGY